jgi:hypothetical protein
MNVEESTIVNLVKRLAELEGQVEHIRRDVSDLGLRVKALTNWCQREIAAVRPTMQQ